VNCELANEYESGGIANVGIQTPKFSSGVLHEIDSGECVHSSISTAFDQSLICCFKNGFLDTRVANEDESSQDEEG
jgi:hypothetical protein